MGRASWMAARTQGHLVYAALDVDTPASFPACLVRGRADVRRALHGLVVRAVLYPGRNRRMGTRHPAERIGNSCERPDVRRTRRGDRALAWPYLRLRSQTS